ncbi:MAG: site-2 protease family protein [Propionibacteriaceae bacterium]|jgi:membrane-associated protease RseP (regulator of RpoE activity)|nr:site-2 protease family protein [Propionibacteriaceae bacterium]
MNSTLVTVIGALIFFALILISVGLHEVGHFIPGKLFRVRVLQFFIGFGKNLWSTQRGETQYGIKVFPLGGYVRLLGMYPPARPGKDTWLKRVADGAREAEWEDITDADVAGHRLYFQKPLWQRLIIMFSGVAMNLLLAFGLFLGVNLAYGQPATSMQIARVWECVDPAASECEPTPASVMGLQAGDRVTAFNGTTYHAWADLTAAVRANGAGAIQLTVIRDGATVELPAVKGLVAAVTDPDRPNQTIQAGYLGVTAATAMVKAGPGETARQMWQMTTQSVGAIIRLPVTAVNVVINLVTGEPRDPNSPMSIFGASVIAGDVASADAPLGSRVAFYLQLLGSVNLFVGLINLVPLLPFDGGHVAAGLYEGVRRGIAKVRGQADPGPADTARLLPLTYVVSGLLLVIGVILIVADIVSPISIF